MTELTAAGVINKDGKVLVAAATGRQHRATTTVVRDAIDDAAAADVISDDGAGEALGCASCQLRMTATALSHKAWATDGTG